MRRLWAILCFAAFSIAGAVQAQNTTVIELYTSQGCSSCPPADKLLHDLAERDDVIALALHVDYWDYIGWKDEFADPRYTERQKGYARAAGARSIYTPQMVIGGVDHVIGTRPTEVTRHVNRHSAKAPVISITTERNGTRAVVRAMAIERVSGGVVVQVVTYRPVSTVKILRGENRGRTLDYANVVTSWTEAERWNGRGELTFTATLPNDEPAVVLFQRPDHGEILAAAHIR
ncbi:MAG: DUF1223 domain-containing protein [Pseudomonadota bacterium]